MPAQSWVTLVVGVLAVVGVALIASTERKVLLAVAGRSARRALAQPRETARNRGHSRRERARGPAMTTTDERNIKAPRPTVAAAAARAYITMAERDYQPVPDWIRDAAAGRPTTPPPE
ncbi:hypothetical protein [Rhodococcoides fascians]|uniref:hypothetical protein n=2 Tax=Mycobacteriales TaxID=85007 RepID=UPI001427D57D|nr:hypothetical protein [Rhodococcus fascians]